MAKADQSMDETANSANKKGPSVGFNEPLDGVPPPNAPPLIVKGNNMTKDEVLATKPLGDFDGLIEDCDEEIRN